jgi:hypothetical protein
MILMRFLVHILASLRLPASFWMCPCSLHDAASMHELSRRGWEKMEQSVHQKCKAR